MLKDGRDVKDKSTDAILTRAGLPLNSRNRLLYNLSGVACLLNIVAWLSLLVGDTAHTTPLSLCLKIPLGILIPGFLYLLTRRRWPAFALCQHEAMTLQLGLLPLVMISGAMVLSRR